LTVLLDEFFPVWTFREIHSVVIDGEADVIIRVIKTLKAEDLSLVNLLMRIRSLPVLLISGRWYSPMKEKVLSREMIKRLK